jgi:uncharacterized DUF497 family protein
MRERARRNLWRAFYTGAARDRSFSTSRRTGFVSASSSTKNRPVSNGFEDRRFDYGEQRFITLGMLRGGVVVIATAETDEEIRVISMRRAEPNEEEIYCGNV